MLFVSISNFKKPWSAIGNDVFISESFFITSSDEHCKIWINVQGSFSVSYINKFLCVFIIARPFRVVKMMKKTVIATAMMMTWRLLLAILKREHHHTCMYCDYRDNFWSKVGLVHWLGLIVGMRTNLFYGRHGNNGQNAGLGLEADGQFCPGIACWKISP